MQSAVTLGIGIIQFLGRLLDKCSNDLSFSLVTWSSFYCFLPYDWSDSWLVTLGHGHGIWASSTCSSSLSKDERWFFFFSLPPNMINFYSEKLRRVIHIGHGHNERIWAWTLLELLNLVYVWTWRTYLMHRISLWLVLHYYDVLVNNNNLWHAGWLVTYAKDDRYIPTRVGFRRPLQGN